ncbi:hypothetical protein KC19_3G077500 [Ceratodon purpureus]|uniref:TPM domain-containing protein n=1 Tax=Ceratodon purpureus TaxID=3225 RepID=A0A8T0IIG8_CERPU|nr:hypothetical protein KC19_3G077500 [Ceratodon purpureus]
MMAEVMARGSSTLLGSASPAVVVPTTKTTPFLGTALPSLSTGSRKSRPQCSLAVTAPKASLGDALNKAKATVGTGLSALALSAALSLGPAVPISDASEFSVLNEGPPSESYVVDDANVLNRVTRSDLKRLLRDLEERKGYHINVITLRKITTKADSFEFADTILEKWYPTLEEGNNKGVVLLVTTQKEGAVTGGPAFTKAVGDKILEAVTAENLPVLATDEKYNEAIYSTAKRLVAAIDGQEDTGGPTFKENKRESNFKSKEETESKRGQFSLVVGGLLVIAFVVPMAQYYAYVSRK